MERGVVKITDAMAAMLADIGRGRDVFAPNPAVRRALWERGLITSRLIGQRWWWMQPTAAGRAALEDHNDRHTGASS
jgi:hypothetical protein